jgi:cytochrome c biogenesis protein CcmG, thiol:disulfide interchange protein DsbE
MRDRLPTAEVWEGHRGRSKVRLRSAAHACPAKRRGARRIQSAASACITAHVPVFSVPNPSGTLNPTVYRLLPALLCAAALAGCGSDDPESAAPSQAKREAALAGAPAPLAKLHAQANELLGGGPKAFDARVNELRGHPIVVNKWASWCGPCRAEFPFFQTQAVKRGKEVAFLGVDGNDNDADARRFLDEFPVNFPSYKDPDLKVSARIKAVAAFPSTAFYDSKGELAYVKQGGYATEEKLAADIERYAR